MDTPENEQEQKASTIALKTKDERIADDAARRLKLCPDMGKEKAVKAATTQIERDDAIAEAELEKATRPEPKKK